MAVNRCVQCGTVDNIKHDACNLEPTHARMTRHSKTPKTAPAPDLAVRVSVALFFLRQTWLCAGRAQHMAVRMSVAFFHVSDLAVRMSVVFVCLAFFDIMSYSVNAFCFFGELRFLFWDLARR